MRQIPLSRGLFALVDDADFVWLSHWKWCVNENGYAIRAEGPKKRRIIVFMHKQIMGFPDNKVDHKNLNKLDNQRNNLRHCTHRQNLANTGIRSTNTTGFKGVVVCKRSDKFIAQIKINYKNIHLGRFDTAEEAALAYDKKAVHEYGEFALLNRVSK